MDGNGPHRVYGRILTIIEATKDKKKGRAMGVPLIVGFEGSTTIAGQMLGVERLCLMMIKKPEKATKYIE